MKVSLSTHEGIHVLVIQGPVSVRECAILKAGITKLFKDGKNRIILDVSTLNDLEGPVISELAHLNVVARELSGEIVIGGLNPKLLEKVKSFAKPPVVSYFNKVSEAAQYLKSSQTKTPPEDEQTGKRNLKTTPAPGDAPPSPAPINPADAVEISELRRQNQQLLTQISELIKERRIPADREIFEEKLNLIEKRLQTSMAGDKKTS